MVARRWLGLALLVAVGVLPLQAFPVNRVTAASSAIRCSGLQLHLGFRWLLDPGTVWSLILRLTR